MDKRWERGFDKKNRRKLTKQKNKEKNVENYFKDCDEDVLEKYRDRIQNNEVDDSWHVLEHERERIWFELYVIGKERIIEYNGHDWEETGYWVLNEDADEEEAAKFLAAEKAAQYDEDNEDDERKYWGLPRKEGYVSPYECSECGRELKDNDMSINNTFEDPDGNRICLGCFENAGYYYCTSCNKVFPEDEIVDPVGQCVCKYCAKAEE